MLLGGGMNLETAELVIEKNMIPTSTSAMKLVSQRAKELSASNHQSHNCNSSHVA